MMTLEELGQPNQEQPKRPPAAPTLEQAELNYLLQKGVKQK